jgi:hypothetical protein
MKYFCDLVIARAFTQGKSRKNQKTRTKGKKTLSFPNSSARRLSSFAL